MVKQSTRRPTSSTWRSRVNLDREGGCWKISGQAAALFAKLYLRKKASLSYKKISEKFIILNILSTNGPDSNLLDFRKIRDQ